MNREDLQLNKQFAFWFQSQSEQQLDKFEESLKKLGTFNTAREFWSYYGYMTKPDQLPEGAQFFVFQDSIKPVWEDPANDEGGRFLLRVKKGWENRIWEELLLSYLTEELEGVCGLVMHAKKNFILVSIWIKDQHAHPGLYTKAQEWIIKTIGLKEKPELEYLAHPKK